MLFVTEILERRHGGLGSATGSPLTQDGSDGPSNLSLVQLIQVISVTVTAVAFVKVELRQQHNDDSDTLLPIGVLPMPAADQKETKRLVGVESLEMLSFCRFYGDQ